MMSSMGARSRTAAMSSRLIVPATPSHYRQVGRLEGSNGEDILVRVDAFLADSAEVVQGKIYALGAGWNTIYVRTFPAVHRRLTVAATVHVPFTDTNQPHGLELKLVTEDGEDHPIGLRMGDDGKPEPVRAMGGEFRLGRPPT